MNEIRINRNLARWILLGVGLIALVVMAVALLAAPQNRFNTVSYVALGVSILGIAGFVLLDPQSVVKAITGRTGQYGLTTALMSLFFIAFVVAVFIIVRSANITPLDLTEASRYRLSDTTIQLLAELEEDVHVTGFFTRDQSDQQREAEIFLNQYQKYSNGRLTYSFVDPDRNPGEAARLGMTRSGVMVFEQGDRTAEAASVTEQSMTSALVQVLRGEARRLYIVTGHGERRTDDFSNSGYSQIGNLLSRGGFEVTSLNLLEQGSVPEDADLVLIAGPTAQFSATEVEALRTYLQNGGSLFLLSEPGAAGGALGSGVLGVDFNADASRVVTAGSDGSARVWNTSTGEELLVMRGHTSDVLDAAFSPDGRRIVTAGADDTVRVWDARTGEQIAQLEGETQLVQRVMYSPDGSLIVSVGQNQVVNVWNAETLQPVGYSPLTATVPLFASAFSPDGSLIAAGGGRTSSGSNEGIVYLWDTRTGEQLAAQTLHSNIVFSLAFSPDGGTLHSVGPDGFEGVIDLTTLAQGSATARYADIGITAIVLPPDGSTIYALLDGTIHIRPADARSADQDVVLSGHTDVIWDMALSSDGRRLASASRDGVVRIWDLETQTELLQLQGHAVGDALLSYLESDWGIRVEDDVVVDLATAREFDFLTPVIYTYDTSSPITKPLWDNGLRTFFITARSITPLELPAGSVLTVKELLSTSGLVNGQMASWGETSNPSATGSLAYDERDIPGPVVVGVAIVNGTTEGRVVVIGDADFASNYALQYVNYGNSDLFLNAANWLAKSEREINLPSPDFTQRTMDRPLTTAEMIIFSIASVCLLPAVGLAAGAVVWVVRRRKR